MTKTIVKKFEDTVVVEVDGKLGFETQEPLRKNLANIASSLNTEKAPRKIIFNLENLEFVGSSGISNFIQALKDFNQSAPVIPKYSHVKSEFQKIIKAFDEDKDFEFFDTVDRARSSYDN